MKRKKSLGNQDSGTCTNKVRKLNTVVQPSHLIRANLKEGVSMTKNRRRVLSNESTSIWRFDVSKHIQLLDQQESDHSTQ